MERFPVADGLGQSHGDRNDAAALANMDTRRQPFEVCGDGDASDGCGQYGFKTLRVIPQQQLEPVTPSLSVVGSAMMSADWAVPTYRAPQMLPQACRTLRVAASLRQTPKQRTGD